MEIQVMHSTTFTISDNALFGKLYWQLQGSTHDAHIAHSFASIFLTIPHDVGDLHRVKELFNSVILEIV